MSRGRTALLALDAELRYSRNCARTREREFRLKLRNLGMMVFLGDGRVKENREILLCKRSSGDIYEVKEAKVTESEFRNRIGGSAYGGFILANRQTFCGHGFGFALTILLGGRRAQRAHFPGNLMFKYLNSQGGSADGAVAARYIIIPQAAPISLTRANQGNLRSGRELHIGATQPVFGARRKLVARTNIQAVRIFPVRLTELDPAVRSGRRSSS